MPRQVRIAELENCSINKPQSNGGGRGKGNCSNYLLAIRLGPARRLSQVSPLLRQQLQRRESEILSPRTFIVAVRTLFAVSCLRLFRRTFGERQAQKRKQLCQAFALAKNVSPLWNILVFRQKKKENARTIRINLRGKFV